MKPDERAVNVADDGAEDLVYAIREYTWDPHHGGGFSFDESFDEVVARVRAHVEARRSSFPPVEVDSGPDERQLTDREAAQLIVHTHPLKSSVTSSPKTSFFGSFTPMTTQKYRADDEPASE